MVTAALGSNWAMAARLVELGADVHAEEAGSGATLLVLAARTQQWALVRQLLDCTDADMDDSDCHGTRLEEEKVLRVPGPCALP